MRYRHCYIGFLLAATILLAADQYLLAVQMLPSATSEPEDQFMMLVVPRNLAEIQLDIESADQARNAASEAERTAVEQRSAASARIEEKKSAISSNKERLKNAKKEKNASETLMLTTEAKALERDMDLLEQREALRDAEIGLAKKRAELATLTRQALDLERQLSLKRAEQPNINVSGPDTAREARVLIDLEKATLEAQKKVAEKQGEVASGAQRVVERQLKALEAQHNLLGGK